MTRRSNRLRVTTIGEAARRSGVKVPTIRYYETIGLLAAPSRSEGNQRAYENDDVRRLAFIRDARELGFDIDAIRSLLALEDNSHAPEPSHEAIARARLVDVEHRLHSLTALKAELQALIERYEKGSFDECRLINVLASYTPQPAIDADPDNGDVAGH